MIWIFGFIAIVATAVALSKRCGVADESERAGVGAPMERAAPQARAS